MMLLLIDGLILPLFGRPAYFRELNMCGVYRVRAASLAKQTVDSPEGSPDVEAVYTSESS